MTTHMVNQSPQLHTAAQAAERLNDGVAIKESWLKAKATAGEIPHVLIAGKIMFSNQHLDEIIAQFERRPEAPKAAPAPRRRSAPSTSGGAVQLQARRPRRKGAA